MGSYTKIDLEEAQDILALYNLDEVKTLRPLSLGISNSNYEVTMKERRLLLKISNDKGMNELKDEQKILQYLGAQGFPFSLTPYLTREGESVYQYKDYFGVLFPFVEGIPPGPSDVTCYEIGKGLAKLHLIKTDTTLRNHEQVGYGAKQIASFVNDELCPSPFKEYYHRIFPLGLEAFIDAPFEKTLIHGDLYYDNTLFQHEHLAAILDFEQAGIGEALLDLAISISGTCLEKGRVITPLIDSYIRGYQSERALSQLEKLFFHQAISVGLFSIALWRIKRFTLGNLNPTMADSYIELLQRAAVFKDTIAPEELQGILS